MKLIELTAEKVLEAYNKTKLKPVYGSFYDARSYCHACALSVVFCNEREVTLKHFATTDRIWSKFMHFYTVDEGEDLNDALMLFYQGFDGITFVSKNKESKYYKHGAKIRAELETVIGKIKSINQLVTV